MALTCGHTITSDVEHVDDRHWCMLSTDHGYSGHRCPCGHTWSASTRHVDLSDGEGAPRQALDGNADGSSIETVSVLRDLGMAVTVGTLVPTGAAVRLDIDDTARWLEPHEAHALAAALNEAATFAVHEDRAGRRG